MLRHIFQKESIQIVHGHAAFSALAHEALFVGSLLGLGRLILIFLFISFWTKCLQNCNLHKFNDEVYLFE